MIGLVRLGQCAHARLCTFPVTLRKVCVYAGVYTSHPATLLPQGGLPVILNKPNPVLKRALVRDMLTSRKFLTFGLVSRAQLAAEAGVSSRAGEGPPPMQVGVA